MLGTTISHYRIVRMLGSGGMGVVYEAEDLKLGRHVALKFLPEDLANDEQALERFRREARTASALNHPNICTIHDIDTDAEKPFIVMELLDGESLSTRLMRGAMPAEQIVSLGIQIADALDAAHSRGIVHRDLKSGNIFITSRGHAKLLDFGLAKATAMSAAAGADVPTIEHAHLTGPGIAMGTTAYMSPEQALGEPLDARTDLFSFGVVLYEMVTGRLPFQGATSAGLFDAILHKPPLPPIALRSDSPPEIDRIISKALEKDRQLRYQSAAEIRADLQRLKRDTSSGVTVAAPQAVPHRHWPAYVGIAVLAVIAIVGSIWLSRRMMSRQSAAPVTTSAPAPATVRSIAVLPFRDITAPAGDSSWGIGMTDAIISRLASLHDLAVRPTSSVLKYVHQDTDPAQAARELDVDSVLNGTYQRTGPVVRVSVQLVSRQTRAALWAEHYDLRAEDMLRFQDEMSQKVVEGLRVNVSGAERDTMTAPMTKSPEAYNLFLQARFYKNEYAMSSGLDSVLQGQRLARDAVTRDPNFSEAWALLADMYTLQAANFFDGTSSTLKRAEEAVERAVALKPDSLDSLNALGIVSTETGRNSDAVRALLRAVKVGPNSEWSWDLLGYACHYAGLVDTAEKAYRRSAELDPTTPRIHWMHGRMLLYTGHADQAEQELKQVVAEFPNQFKAMAFLGKFLYYQGKYDEAEQYLKRSVELRGPKGDYSPLLMSAYLYAARGQRDKISPEVFSIRPEQVVDGDLSYYLGGVYALLGEKQNALRWLRRAVELGNHNYPWFSKDKNWDKLRGDAQYEKIMADVRARWESYKKEFGIT